eukprot:TRINITY_DN7129_c1_g1_i2.p1 TRINITY_DN7129_c1_g1~~TRINITY_DN7129_c1_g1_i2.p1  ORF type:complete len:105 (-),score=3.47 TRINITY_DN7129_c1_g1_i2:11-325(-)
MHKMSMFPIASQVLIIYQCMQLFCFTSPCCVMEDNKILVHSRKSWNILVNTYIEQGNKLEQKRQAIEEIRDLSQTKVEGCSSRWSSQQCFEVEYITTFIEQYKQ